MSNIIYKLNENFSFRHITNVSEFLGLRDLWNDLAAKHPSSFPFFSFEWFHLWLEHFLHDNELFILLLFNRNRPSAIAPLMIKDALFRGLKVRRISLIGNVYSPFRYFIFETQDVYQSHLYIRYILTFLSEYYTNWDMFELSDVPEENGKYDILTTATAKSGFTILPRRSIGSWYLDNIHYSADDYVANLPKKIRKDIAYCSRRLNKTGELEFKLITDTFNLDNYMDIYYDVYSRSWQETEAVGPTFHRDLAKIAAHRNWLRLGFLFLDDCAVSAQFWISCNNYAYILKTVYDQNFKSYSPGKILTLEMIKYVVDHDKVNTIDYGQGDEPYKKDWTPSRRERKSVLVFNRNAKGKCLSLLYNKIAPLYLKYVKNIL